MKQRRNEIYEIKEDIYSANIEKSKLNEKLYTLTEMAKKVEDGYHHYKEVSDKVDEIKSIKDVMSFKNVNLKNKIPARRNGNAGKSITYKAESQPTAEFVATTELKDSFNKLHYNDKMTLEDNKVYTQSDCKEILMKNTANSAITLYAALNDTNKYEIQTSFCENMIVAYPSLEKLRGILAPEGNLLIIELQKNAHYIPAMTADGDFCALIGGDVNITYKEKVNTGKEIVDVWHMKRKS
ncbi:MAG: hypothetical protein J6M02_05010 [Clostridia bacterium]|nr:hypothetical protein [Clostridia bacterium]